MLKIGDFSRLAQVSIKALRYYDEIGLLKPAEIDRFTGYRYYTLDQLRKLIRIVVLKELGFSLEQIAQMLDNNLAADEIRGMLRLKQMELQEGIETAQARLTQLDMRLRQFEMEGKMPDYEVVIKRTEPQQVLSVRQIVLHIADVRHFFNEVKTVVRNHHIKRNGAWLVLYHHAGYRDSDLDIEIAVPVDASISDNIQLGDGRQMLVRTIPAIETAATVLVQGSYDELDSAYMVLNTYIHEHAHNYLGPAREIYLREADDTVNPAEYLTEIQYPIGEHTDEKMIDGVELPDFWEMSLYPQLPLSRRARTALELSKLEAIALKQAEINPVHILLTLMRESEGLAAHVLGSLAMNIEQMRQLVAHGTNRVAEVTITDAARQVVEYAHAEAQQLGHDYIGTEHLLLGLVYQSDNSVIHLFRTSKVSTSEVQEAVLQTLKR